MKRLKYSPIILNTILLSVINLLGLTRISLAHKNHHQSSSTTTIEETKSTLNQNLDTKEVSTDESKHKQMMTSHVHQHLVMNLSLEAKTEFAKKNKSLIIIKKLIPQPTELILALIIINPFLLHFFKNKSSSS